MSGAYTVNVFMASLGRVMREKSSNFPELHTTVEKLVDVARLAHVAAYVLDTSMKDGENPLGSIVSRSQSTI